MGGKRKKAKNKSAGTSKQKKRKVTHYCCDPFEIHTTKKMNELRNTSKTLVKVAETIGKNISAGQWICKKCYFKIYRYSKLDDIPTVQPQPVHSNVNPSTSGVTRKRTTAEQSTSAVHISSDSEPSFSHISTVSKSSSSYNYEVDVSAVINKLNVAFDEWIQIDQSKRQQKKYSTQILNDIIRFLSRHIFPRADNPLDEFCEIITELKTKFGTAPNSDEKVRILSILPKSWPIQKVVSEFNATNHIARTTKQLVSKHGILCGTEKRISSKKLDDVTIKKVQEFYRSGDISRICPGQRDYITLNDEGKRQTFQRQLILMNVREAYVLFKNDERFKDIKIGFSKFAELRPKECLLALEKHGTHTTCVCQYHQNFKLCFNALQRLNIYNDFSHYRDLLNSIVCNKNQDDCRFGNCSGCLNLISESVATLQQKLDSQMFETITIKQWSNAPGK